MVDFNNFIWSNWRITSQRNSERQWNAYDRSGQTDPFGDLLGTEILIMNDFMQMQTATLKQTQIDFQVPTLNVNFEVNGLVYFTHSAVNNDTGIKTFDLTTLQGNFGSPPLILNKGETWNWSIVDGNRLNASDRLGFRATVWAINTGYPLA